MMRALSRLFRPRLALLNAVSGLGGYLLYPADVRWSGLSAVFLGVLLLAAAASALNQVLEQDLDQLMERTRQRPLTTGELTVTSATLLGAGGILAGLMLLIAGGGIRAALPGVLALFWYLAVYTPLKRRSAWALAAGGICGALPPVIGWCVAGGNPLDYRIMFLAGLLYLWQIPHFWLFQRRHADDYRRAGIPAADAVMNGCTPFTHFRLWIGALATAAMLLPAFGIVGQAAGFWYAFFPLPLLLVSLIPSERFLFSYLNLFPLLLTLTLFLQR